jgi:hypothetical protein
LRDLIVYTSHGIHVVPGDGAAFSGDYVVPRDAAYTLGDCASSNTGWCGFARALQGSWFAVAGEGGVSQIQIYEVPLSNGQVTPVRTREAGRAQEDSMAGVAILDGTFAVGNSAGNYVSFVDYDSFSAELPGSQADVHFGYWVASTFDQEGDELLLVSSPQTQYGNSQGLVYVFNVSQNGLPESTEHAVYILEPPEGFGACGSRTGGGIVTNDGGTFTAVASACTVSGGAVYLLDHSPPPAPFVGPNDIEPGGAPNTFRIRRWVVEAFTSNFVWLNGLAQTEVVRNGAGAIIGWRLHGITSGSPLHRAGLRTADVIRRVNNTNLTSPAVVTDLFSAFADADSISIGITRNGANRTLHYQVVP